MNKRLRHAVTAGLGVCIAQLFIPSLPAAILGFVLSFALLSYIHREEDQ